MNIEEKLSHTPTYAQWKELGIGHHHGVCIPLFSLHSEKSCGIGEFLDLLPMITWCKEVGMDIIQLLPINDTSHETSPYSAISAFALNPIHLSLSELPGIEKIAQYENKLAKMRYWNQTPKVKYAVVRELKESFLREYFLATYDDVKETEDYQTFIQENDWLEPYALFKAIKDSRSWLTWESWPEPLKNPDERSYQELLVQYSNVCQLYQFLQYHCFAQMERVKRFATEHGVFLKGDIPILIGRDSADVWHRRHLFHMELAAGAPPDRYTKKGQYWGFPVYNWDALLHEDYKWWRKRLRLGSHLYHLYRIDHVVGFFRLWAIPLDHAATDGSFLPPHKEQWIPHGKRMMGMMIESAPILPVGEDLGLVPKSVSECLYELGICGTKMMRWEVDEKGEYLDPKTYEPMTMSTVSTHDSDTMQLWWRHFPKEARAFCRFKKWPYHPFLSQDRHFEMLHDCHHSSSLLHINLLQEYLALFPELISENPSNERINIPGRILDTNWTYRFRTPIERMTTHIPLKEAVRKLTS